VPARNSTSVTASVKFIETAQILRLCPAKSVCPSWGVIMSTEGLEFGGPAKPRLVVANIASKAPALIKVRVFILFLFLLTLFGFLY
jgi:hypothetical protein